MKHLHIIALVITLLLNISVAGNNYMVHRLNTQSQLPVANIHTVYQSADGYMWYGTRGGGLCRDNGYQVNVFRPSIISGLPESNDVNCITENAAGMSGNKTESCNIWFGTDAGLFRLDSKTLNMSMPLNIRGHVYALFRDHKQRLWIGTDNSVYMLSSNGKKIWMVYHSIRKRNMNQFYEDSQNRFFALFSGELMQLDTKTMRLRHVRLSESIDPVSMVESSDGKGYWIATWNHGVVFYKYESGQITRQPNTLGTTDKSRCLSMIIDSQYGLMWVTTMENLYVYQIKGHSLIHYDTSSFISQDQMILDLLYEDHYGNIWVPGFVPNTFIISSANTDIRRYAIDKMRNTTGYPLITDRIVLDPSNPNDNIWIYQGRIGLMHYQPSTENLITTGGFDYDKCIKPARNGGIWAAKSNALLHLQFTHSLQKDVTAKFPEPIRCILDDGDMIYIGTDRAVYRYSIKGRSIKKLCNSPSNVVDMAVRDGTIFFIAHDKGIFRSDGQHFTSPYDSYSALSVNKDATLWAVSESGGVYYAATDTLIEDKQMSIRGNAFLDVACDYAGHVWTLCNQFAREYNPTTHAFRTIRNTDPQVDVAYFFQLEQVDNEHIGIGGAGAFCVLASSAQLDRRSSSQHTPIVTAIDFGDSTLLMGPGIERVDIPAGQNTFSMKLSTLDPLHAGDISYAYRVEGWNDDWIYLPQGVNTLYLSNLPNGTFRLMLRATDSSGCWQETIGTLVLHRIPFWWQTWWARLLFLCIATAIVYSLWLLGIRIRKLRALQRQRKALALREIAAPSQEELLALKDKEFLQRAKDCVEQHLAEPEYNVEHLASDLCMSRSNLNRRLQPLTGQSPVEFIRDIRLKQAAQLLQAYPDMPVADVAKRVGFAVPGYFTKCFKEHFGVLPTQY